MDANDNSDIHWAPKDPERQANEQFVIDESTNGFCTGCGSPLAGEVACLVCQSEMGKSNRFRKVQNRESSGVKSALWLYFLLLASFGLIGLDGEDVKLDIFVCILDALIVLLWVVFHRKQVVPLMRLPKNPLWLLAGLALGVLTFTVTSLFLNVVCELLGLPILQMSESYVKAGYPVIVPILMIVVQPMLAEEFAFRGVIYKALSRGLTVKEAMLVSSCLFAVLHLSPLAFPHTFMMGILAVVILYKTGSIWPGVLLHGMHNFLALGGELWW